MTTKTKFDGIVLVNNTDVQNLAGVVRQRRVDREWTQDHLSKATGLSQGQVSLFERGVGIKVENLLKICTAVGLQVQVVEADPSAV